jgi:hypothetical protein
MHGKHSSAQAGCLLGHVCRYLFRPRPAVAQQLQPEAARVLTTPGALKLGIHLRLGDAEMEGDGDDGRERGYCTYSVCPRQALILHS